MPIIAYQSFNANASHDHGLKAMLNQTFTRAAQAHMEEYKHQSLVIPHDMHNMAKAYIGPPEKKTPVDIKTFEKQNADAFIAYVEQFRSDYLIDLSVDELLKRPDIMEKMQDYMISQTVGVFGSQIAAVWGNFARHFEGRKPDIMVCGEIDASHPDLAKAFTSPDITVKVAAAKKACQSFSVISQSALGSKVNYLGEDTGYVACSVMDINVLFVHVPNALCQKRDEMVSWYSNIAKRFGSSCMTLDLVIGDTNQASGDFTRDVLSKAFGVLYGNALGSEKQITKVDSVFATPMNAKGPYANVAEGGTNAGGTKMFDVAVFNTQTIKANKVVYVSQASSGVTITDHSGLGVDVEKL
jgi:hypothetical protein